MNKSICQAFKYWGIGTTTDNNGEVISYGWPVTDNPLRFHPDYEVCTDLEIKNHEEACKVLEEQKLEEK